MRLTVFAPGSVGNVGPGLDVLGSRWPGQDWVTAELLEVRGIELRDPGHPDLPVDPARHSAALAASAVLQRAGGHRGLALWVLKGLPLSGGQGGSAASAVAGAVAANECLGRPLGVRDLLEACLEAEAAVAGRHANLAPSLLGVPSCAIARSTRRRHAADADGLTVVLAHRTSACATPTRAAPPTTVLRDVAIHQMAQVAAMVAPLPATSRCSDVRWTTGSPNWRARRLPTLAAARCSSKAGCVDRQWTDGVRAGEGSGGPSALASPWRRSTRRLAFSGPHRRRRYRGAWVVSGPGAFA
jgi:homoserine kinase